jgi:hypothetical protein
VRITSMGRDHIAFFTGVVCVLGGGGVKKFDHFKENLRKDAKRESPIRRYRDGVVVWNRMWRDHVDRC